VPADAALDGAGLAVTSIRDRESSLSELLDELATNGLSMRPAELLGRVADIAVDTVPGAEHAGSRCCVMATESRRLPQPASWSSGCDQAQYDPTNGSRSRVLRVDPPCLLGCRSLIGLDLRTGRGP
jgi:hypothetical protein